MFEEQKNRVNNIFSGASEYIKIKEEIWKLTLVEKSGRVVSVLASAVLIGSIFLFCILFLALALGYLLTEMTGKASIGFSIVAVLLLIIGCLLYIKREPWIMQPMLNNMIRNLTDETDETDK